MSGGRRKPSDVRATTAEDTPLSRDEISSTLDNLASAAAAIGFGAHWKLDAREIAMMTNVVERAAAYVPQPVRMLVRYAARFAAPVQMIGATYNVFMPRLQHTRAVRRGRVMGAAEPVAPAAAPPAAYVYDMPSAYGLETPPPPAATPEAVDPATVGLRRPPPPMILEDGTQNPAFAAWYAEEAARALRAEG